MRVKATPVRFVAWLAVACALLLSACDNGQSPTGPAPVSPSPPESTAPAPAPPPAPVERFLIGAGDIGECGRDGAAKTAALLDQMEGTVFAAGDNAYHNGTPDEFRTCYHPFWGRHLSRTRAVPGNHDYGTPGAQGYFQYFGSAAGPSGLGYYSFDLGAWHVVTLNTNIAVDAASPQGAWLRSDLSASGARCTIAIFHHPLFSSSDNGGESRVRHLWRVLHEFGVEAVVNGHEHVYERFALQDPDGRIDNSRGIRQFTVGTGGARHYGFPRSERNSEARAAVWGVIRFTLRASDYSWEFVPVAGESFHDSGTDPCH